MNGEMIVADLRASVRSVRGQMERSGNMQVPVGGMDIGGVLI